MQTRFVYTFPLWLTPTVMNIPVPRTDYGDKTGKDKTGGKMQHFVIIQVECICYRHTVLHCPVVNNAILLITLFILKQYDPFACTSV